MLIICSNNIFCNATGQKIGLGLKVIKHYDLDILKQGCAEGRRVITMEHCRMLKTSIYCLHIIRYTYVRKHNEATKTYQKKISIEGEQ